MQELGNCVRLKPLVKHLAFVGCAAVLWTELGSARLQTVVIKDGLDRVACLASQHDSSDRLTVQIRTPGVSVPEVAARLPGGVEAFRALPVRVSLLDKSGESSVRRPTVTDPALKRPVVDGTTLPEEFVSVVFPKAWLVAGMVIRAERSVIGTDGVRITSQTTCPISEADAGKWR
jgi:hypothetical protein